MAIKISAIVSAYYSEKYIEARILNLQEQTLPPEIIVVCQDGSFEQKIAVEARAVVIATEDIPPLSVAWNLAIKQARGRYITTANTDDFFYKTGIEQLYKTISKENLSVCFSDVDLLHNSKIPKRWRRILAKRGVIDDAYHKILKRCIIGPMPMWRRELHKTHGYFDETLNIVCDWDWWLRLAHAGEQFYYLPQAVGVYNMRNDSLERKDRDATQNEKKAVKARWQE